MALVDITSFNSNMKDLYPGPGARLKQWVVDQRRLSAWIRETCPRFEMPIHADNTGTDCWSSGSAATWHDLFWHSHCHVCGDAAEAYRDRPDVAEWLGRTDKPAVESDHTKLSDEVQPDIGLHNGPLSRLFK